MAYMPGPTAAPGVDDPFAEFDDVMAFIDGFYPPPSSTNEAFEHSLLFGSSGEDSEDDQLLNSFLDAVVTVTPTPTIALETPGTATANIDVPLQTPPSPSPAPQFDSSSASNSSAPTSPVDAAPATAAVSKRKRPVSNASASTVDAAAATADANPPPPQIKEATRKRNTYREKMKREMQYLRSRASEMEQQLAALRQGAVALSDADKQLIDSSWKRIAQNQLEARQASEAENMRLRRVLQTHMEMSKSLEQTLGKRLDAAFLVDESKPKTKRGRMSKKWEDEGFGELVDDLDDTYERLGQVMHDSGVARVTGETTRYCQMKTDVSPSGVVLPYIEVTDASIAPFHPRLTARAVWRSLLHDFLSRSNSMSGPGNVWHTGNTIAANCRTKHRLKDQHGQDQFLKAKVVMRKYVDEESRMVLVWRAHNESESDPTDVYVDETGWSVVQPIAGPCGFSETGSIVRTCVHFVERHRSAGASMHDASATQHPSLGSLTDLVMSCSEEDMNGIVKAVENILLDEATAGSLQSAS